MLSRMTVGLVNCSAVPPGHTIGPAETFESLGHWSTVVYIILALHALPVFIVSTLTLFRLSSSCSTELWSSLSVLVGIPPTLMTLATIGILIPSVGPIIELLLEVTVSVGLVQFVRFTTNLCQGPASLVEACAEKKILLPIGSPPCVCLLALNKPPITDRNLRIVRKLPYLLVLVKVCMLCVEIAKVSLHTNEDPNYFSVANLHNLVSIPAGVAGVYSYNIYLVIVSQLLPDCTKMNLGYILLLLFIFSDCLRLFFVFLTGTGMLTCVPPYLTLSAVEHLLKNCMKGFIITCVGMPFLKLCSEKTDVIQLLSGGRYSSEPSSDSICKSGEEEKGE